MIPYILATRALWEKKKERKTEMITLEAQGPVKETELFVDLLCSFGFVKTYSQTYKNIEKTRL